MMRKQDNGPVVPLGVWIFWSLLGFIVLLGLFHWITGGKTPDYIAPIAACLSALAGTASVYMATRTLNQNRKDRQDEIEAKHPRFKIIVGEITWKVQTGENHQPDPIYELKVLLQNVKEHSAKFLTISGSVLNKDGNILQKFINQPTDYVERNDTVWAETTGKGIAESDEPYFVKVSLKYRDSRTGKKYAQNIWRKFYLAGVEEEVQFLLETQKSEIEHFDEAFMGRFEQSEIVKPSQRS